MKKSILIFFLATSLTAAHSQTQSLDAKFIASNYYKGVVKILLYDSLAAREDSAAGYIGRGSGFIVSEDGIIFTNRHVVEMCVLGYIHYDYYSEANNTVSPYIETYSSDLLPDSNLIKINRIGYPAPIVQVYHGKGENDYKLYYAKVLSVSMGSFDGAMLQIVSGLDGKPLEKNFMPLPLGNSDSTAQGEDLCVYGFPENYSGGMNMMLKEMSTLTFGKHSGFDFAYSKDFGYIKTEAAINKGNSGGPVFNQENKVIGIATAAFNKTNIGLVGGINAMYYIVAPEIEVLQKLSAKGLKLPRSAGSIKTISGNRQPALTQKQIEEHNKKKKEMHEMRMAKKLEQSQQANTNYFSKMYRPKMKGGLGGSIGAGTYSRGDLDIFWQNINEDPSLTATGSGSPLIWNVYFQLLFNDKPEKNFWGFNYEYGRTSKRAIASSNEYKGAHHAVELGSSAVSFRLVYAHKVSPKTYVVIDPSGFIASMKGKISVYGSEYAVKNSGASFGWQASGGINFMAYKMIGITFRAGYQSLTVQEKHTEDRDGISSDYMYFFLNETSGDAIHVNWSGFYCSAGIVFSSMGLKTSSVR